MSQQTNTLEYNSFAGIVRTYFELTKPGITLMVLISMMIGFFMGSLSIGFNWIVFLHVAFGTFYGIGFQGREIGTGDRGND